MRRSASARWIAMPGVLLLAFLALPVIALLVRALAGSELIAQVASPAVADALVLSVVTTAVSVVIVVCFGTPLALLLARRPFASRALVETFVDLPIILPPSVAGLALLLVLGRQGFVGQPLHSTGLQVPFTTVAVVLAQVFVSAPFFVRAARSGFATVDAELADAARVDGAGEGQVFRRIVLPLAAPALAAGIVMAWARALGEFGATIMFAGNFPGRTQTLPLLVYGEFQTGDVDASVAAAAILVLAAFAVLLAVRTLRWPRVLDARLAR
jgi:molybdate transport system permease protein